MLRLFLILLFTLLTLSAMENEHKTVASTIEKEECNESLFKNSGLKKPIKTQDLQEILESYYNACEMIKNNKQKEARELLLELKSSVFDTIDVKLNDFLDSWKKSWESREFETYASHYDNSFINNSLWPDRKQKIFSNTDSISTIITDPVSKKIDENNYIIKFYQEYTTGTRCDKGYKTLHVSCDKAKTECKITQEAWEEGAYKKSLLLMPYIDKSLKELEFLKTDSLVLDSSKKKSLHPNLQSIMILS